MGFFDWFFNKSAPVPVAKPETDTPRAVLIGNIGYPSAPLDGCWNDTVNVNQALKDLYGAYWSGAVNATALGGEIRILQDCPKAPMIEACKWLAKTSGPKVLLTSGHGTQIPCSDEPDGFTEVFCPVDFNWTADTMVTDDEFVALFKDCVGPFNWLSDSCHSGDLIRNLMRGKKKSFPMPAPMRLAMQGRHRKIRKAIAKGELNIGFVSGCRSDQTSADAFIDGNYCGAMTYYFVKALRANPQAKLKDLVKATNDALRINGYEQQPGAEGAYINKPFLG